MAKDIVGTPKKVSIAGVGYRVAADADFKDAKPAFKNEAEQTTGGTFREMVSQPQEVESVTLVVNGDDLDRLKAVQESQDDVTLSYETRAGDAYSGKGWIDFDSRQTASGKLEVKLFPRDGWTSTVAP